MRKNSKRNTNLPDVLKFRDQLETDPSQKSALKLRSRVSRLLESSPFIAKSDNVENVITNNCAGDPIDADTACQYDWQNQETQTNICQLPGETASVLDFADLESRSTNTRGILPGATYSCSTLVDSQSLHAARTSSDKISMTWSMDCSRWNSSWQETASNTYIPVSDYMHLVPHEPYAIDSAAESQMEGSTSRGIIEHFQWTKFDDKDVVEAWIDDEHTLNSSTVLSSSMDSPSVPEPMTQEDYGAADSISCERLSVSDRRGGDYSVESNGALYNLEQRVELDTEPPSIATTSPSPSHNNFSDMVDWSVMDTPECELGLQLPKSSSCGERLHDSSSQRETKHERALDRLSTRPSSRWTRIGTSAAKRVRASWDSDTTRGKDEPAQTGSMMQAIRGRLHRFQSPRRAAGKQKQCSQDGAAESARGVGGQQGPERHHSYEQQTFSALSQSLCLDDLALLPDDEDAAAWSAEMDTFFRAYDASPGMS